MAYFIRWHLPWLAMMGLIFWLSSIPDLSQSVFVFRLSDKLIHFLIFGILGWLTARGLNRCRVEGIQEHYLLFAGIMVIIFAATDEWHQSFVPGRFADWLDWLADTLGIIVFIFAYSRFKQT